MSPCYDAQAAQDREIAKAALCAIIRRYGVAIFDGCDLARAGLTKGQIEGWWETHSYLDGLKDKHGKP